MSQGLRGGTFPTAYVYPAAMRATRDLLRRRNYLTRKHADLLSHVQNTNSQYNMEPFGAKITHKSNRYDLAEQFLDPEVRASMETDLALIDVLDTMKQKLELHIMRNAKKHDPQALYRLRSVPGIGPILSLVILYEIGDIGRFERVQDFVSYGWHEGTDLFLGRGASAPQARRRRARSLDRCLVQGTGPHLSRETKSGSVASAIVRYAVVKDRRGIRLPC